MAKQVIEPDKNPWEKKEREESVDFRTDEGAWHATKAQAQSGAILNPKQGQDTVIRMYRLLPRKGITDNIEEILHGIRLTLEMNAFKDGWEFSQEPKIRKDPDGAYTITCIMTPAFKLGLKIGATNDTARSATDLLRQAQKKLKP